MNLAHRDKNKRTVETQETVNFSSSKGLHLVVIKASARGEKMLKPVAANNTDATDDEDLVVKLDGKVFPKLENEKDLKNSPATFNGGRLHGTSETIYFLTHLKGSDHSIQLITDENPNTATLNSIEVYTLEPEASLTVNINEQSENKEREPWITFVLDGLPLESLDVVATTKKRFRDSDDLKIIVDGEIKTSLTVADRGFEGWLHRFWYFVGSITKGERKTANVNANLTDGLHYIEFWADRAPTLHFVKFVFGERPTSEHTKPTVDNPKWTGDFNDDSETVILARAIYAETGGESKEAKTGVGWVIRNRVGDVLNRWLETYHGVILDPEEFEPFTDSTSEVFRRLTDPPIDNPLEKGTWEDSYEIAVGIINNTLVDPTYGANHFYSESSQESQNPPYWADEDKFTVQIGTTKFYKL